MDDVGAIYHVSSDWQQVQWVRAMEHLARAASRPRFALDLGCGTGVRTLDLLNRFPGLERVDAIDANAEMLATARRLHGDERIHYAELAIERLGELDHHAYDLVIAHYSLHWVAEKDALFTCLRERCSSNARLVVATCERVPEMLRRIDIRAAGVFHYLDRAGWERLLTANGWRVRDVFAAREPHDVGPPDEFLPQWFAASAGRAFPGGFKTDAALSARLRDEFGRDGGLRFFEDTLILVAELDSGERVI